MKAKPVRSGATRRSDLGFWLPTGRLRSNFVAARLAETETRTRQTGNPVNVGAHAQVRYRCRQQKPPPQPSPTCREGLGWGWAWCRGKWRKGLSYSFFREED